MDIAAADREPILLGIDLGTGGVRALAVSAQGETLAEHSVALPQAATATADRRHEQQPDAWWRAVCEAVGRVAEQLRRLDGGLDRLAAAAVDGTSGTVVPVDAAGRPLRAALMYNDGRAGDEAERLNAAGREHCEKLGYRFEASFALAKILWLAEHEPACFEAAARFLHQADYIVGRLTGRFDLSDYSNALKTGYDLIDGRWPDWIAAFDGVAERLPEVRAPGERLACISAEAARETGLPPRLPIVAGATDGVAAALASGVRSAGDCNTTLGTTLVFKAVSATIARDPQGRVYSHKLPGGLWLPGAASNTGGEWTGAWFADADLAALDEAARKLAPVQHVAYPLARIGERFPFRSAEAAGFVDGAETTAERYAACLTGTALVERAGYEALDEIVGSRFDAVYSTGGGSRSDVWMQLRADVADRTFHRPACPQSAFGAAVLAAAGTVYDGDLPAAIAAMVRTDQSFEPRSAHRAAYDDLYGRFRAALAERGCWR